MSTTSCEFVTACLNAATVGVTAVYAFLTYKILKANQETVRASRDQIEASVRPYVYFDLVNHWPDIEGFIKNTGRTPAHDIKIVLAPKIETEVQGKRKVPNLLTATHSFLAPDRELHELLGEWKDLRNQNPSMVFTGTVTYRDQRKTYVEPFRLDLNTQEGITWVARVDVPNEIRRINENLEKITGLLSKTSK